MEIRVTAAGELTWNGWRLACALGRSGVTAGKREGDGATPAGRFPLRHLFYRPDRLAAPRSGLPVKPLGENDGWCDDPADTNYNRLVELPYPASCEALWRDDEIYDLIVPLGYNDDPPVAHLGSAIFLHVARPGLAPTEGCVALPGAELLDLLVACDPSTRLVVET
jgi:L,D-peptidoglycan transpeptidase YkuD (ErfK/YbiS/YcfS/YnhG family)